MESLRTKIEELAGRDWATALIVRAAFADNLSIVGEELSEPTTYYSDRGPIQGRDTEVSLENLPPQYVVKRLENIGLSIEDLIKSAEKSGTSLTMEDINLILDSHSESRVNVRNATETEIGFEKTPMRERLENGLYWEATHEEGNGIDADKVAPAQNLLRCLKAQYAVLRVVQLSEADGNGQLPPLSRTIGEPSVRFAGEKPNTRLFHEWKVGRSICLTIEFARGGAERRFYALKEVDGTYKRVSHIAGMEFPFRDAATSKDEKGKWIFPSTPSVPHLVAVLRSPRHRKAIEEFYNDFFENIKASIKRELEEENCAMYVALNYEDMGKGITTEPGGEKRTDLFDQSFEADFWVKELMDDNTSPVDAKWSENTVYQIVKEMDPEAKDYATKPCESRGHSSIQQSLRWLLGGFSKKVKNGENKWKRGFVSHNALTRADREYLMAFARKSWDKLNQDKAESEREAMLREQSFSNAVLEEESELTTTG